ncbi:hypothetical protein ABIB56_001548 [Glaciihabitans sp. UYNi722]
MALDTVGESLNRVAMQTSIADVLADQRSPSWDHLPALPSLQMNTPGPGL